jgi:hypothetical protein
VDWGDERFVKLYSRNTPDWLVLSFEAQALIALIMRVLDRAGVLDLGRQGKRGVAIAIGHPHRWATIEPALDELLANGDPQAPFVLAGNKLVMRNFLEAQSAKQSDRVRQQESRARRRDIAAAVAAGIVEPSHVTSRDDESQDVTESHDRSREVTIGHSDADTDADVPEEKPDPSSLRSSGAPPVTIRDSEVGEAAPAPVARQDAQERQPALAGLEVPSKPATGKPAASNAKPAADARPRKAAIHRAIDIVEALHRGYCGKGIDWHKRKNIGLLQSLLDADISIEEIDERARIMYGLAGKYPAECPDVGTLVANWDKFVRPINGTRNGQGRVATAEELGPSREEPFKP